MFSNKRFWAIGIALIIGLAFIPTVSTAKLSVSFEEGAPKDRFEITNNSSCALVDATILLDLSASAAGLVFDVTPLGAGVEVYQPFELVSGNDALIEQPVVTDGQRQIEFKLTRLDPGEAIAFTIDVDDTASARGITISGSEIEGALVAYSRGGKMISARFSRDATAEMTVIGCEA